LRRENQHGQAFVETLLMIWLLTVLISAIIQVFLAHNYIFQMANNAYYSLFKDKAYNTYNKPDVEFSGFPNWPSKPLRTVRALPQAGGKIHEFRTPEINWDHDDRASLPIMPFFKDSIMEELQNRGISRQPLWLKVGTKIEGRNFLDQKTLRMAMGTEGGFEAFFDMIGSIIQIAQRLGENYTDYTEGYNEGDLEGMEDQYNQGNNQLNSQDPDAAQKARDQWDVEHEDYNHDGYREPCEAAQGDNHPSCKNDRPWE
jgi:hypothetical protein